LGRIVPKPSTNNSEGNAMNDQTRILKSIRDRREGRVTSSIGRSNPRKPKSETRKTALWKGPLQDGITFSLLSKFLVCRERFRLMVVEGLRESEGFDASIEYGQMWHDAEEAHARGKDWQRIIRLHYAKWRENYPASEDETRKWFRVCQTTFPLYVQYWSKHPMEKQREPVLAENPFAIVYTLPSGRKVKLRGKFDCVLAVNKFRHLWLQENKSKGKIDEEGITKTLHENMQTMLYLIALHESMKEEKDKKTGAPRYLFDIGATKHHIPNDGKKPPIIKGVMYNVIKRPLADMYSIRQRVKETEDGFYGRLGENIKEDSFNPDGSARSRSNYFHRWEAEISEQELESFKDKVFHPILEQLLDWWEWIEVDPFNP
jgi:hypothetical protein